MKFERRNSAVQKLPSEDEGSLIEEAILLLAETTGKASVDRDHQIHEWQLRSRQHERAMERALSEWTLLGRLRNRPMDVRQKCQFAVQLLIAQSSDHPLRAAAIVLLVLGLGFQSGRLLDESTQNSRQVATASSHAEYRSTTPVEGIARSYRTARGEQSKIALSDGSLIWLNWNTEVLILDEGDETRVDVLLGDVLFEVAEGRKNSLIVHAGQTHAYARDTEFAIHSHGGDDALFQVKKGVLMIDGSQESDTRNLTTAQQTHYANGVAGGLSEADINSIAAWRDGKLVFDERPLREALWELSHFTERPIYVGTLRNHEVGVTATYALSEADAAVMQLADTHALELIKENAARTLVRSIDPGEY